MGFHVGSWEPVCAISELLDSELYEKSLILQDTYRKQAELLIRCLPEVEKQTCFALQGGTAINLFVRDMPRLSVNIELLYLPVELRDQALLNIESALNEISGTIEQNIAGSKVTKTSKENHINKLFVKHDGVQIKIEAGTIQRGAIFEVEEKSLCERAANEFTVNAKIHTLAVAELYGSKIVTALDRQHPRDLFDVKLLFENEGITENIRKAFIICLASHPRPMPALLNPYLKDIEHVFLTQFKGMVNIPIALSDLLTTRTELIRYIRNNLTTDERQFLISVKSGVPDWSLINIPGGEQLPGIKWKLQNVRKMGENKQQLAIDKLKNILDIN